MKSEFSLVEGLVDIFLAVICFVFGHDIVFPDDDVEYCRRCGLEIGELDIQPEEEPAHGLRWTTVYLGKVIIGIYLDGEFHLCHEWKQFDYMFKDGAVIVRCTGGPDKGDEVSVFVEGKLVYIDGDNEVIEYRGSAGGGR